MRTFRVPVSARVAALMVCGVAAAAAQPATPSAPPTDILSIARREAEREREALQTRVREVLTELQSSSDEGLGLVQTRIQELAGLGSAAIPLLVQAMNQELLGPGVENAALNAARALARIPGGEADAALEKLAKEGTARGRRLAVHSLGLRSDPALLPLVFARLEDPESSVMVQALQELGRFPPQPQILAKLTPFLSAADDRQAAAAIHSAAGVGQEATDQAVLARIRAEQADPAPSESVFAAALEYLRARPVAAALPDIEARIQDPNATPRVRSLAVAALQALAGARPELAKDVTKPLKAALHAGPRSVTEAAALVLVELGDESAVDAVTGALDDEIDDNPRNYAARYDRAELYLRFRMWKKAERDFQEGLKIEKEPREPDRVHLGLARACAGQKDFRDAQKWLRRLNTIDVTRLPELYAEFREMAADSRYRSSFEKP